MKKKWPEDRDEAPFENDLSEKDLEANEIVYGDTDLDPNRDDQRDAHEADSDERV